MSRLQRACDNALSWPIPGAGHTLGRWQALSALAEQDLVLGRLTEAHADAVAIAAELGAPGPESGQRWGVWAAEGPGMAVKAERTTAGWHLRGTKPWCSGAHLLTHALVTAATKDGRQLFTVNLTQPAVSPQTDGWTGPGMARADTQDVLFAGACAVPVGDVDAYLERPGFWLGGIGVAACWFGGALALSRPLTAAAGTRDDPHLRAHAGAVHVALRAAGALLREVAREVDAEPRGPHHARAQVVRAAVAAAVTDVLDRVGRALGPAPLARDARHAQLAADLTVYVRQHHAERDLAALGADLPAEIELP
ncbi:MAG TPA: acyl-CoA dehydrogenase [Mycobacteriales bacterium]|jgi:alkylation response protein AidB-like acyl-CoA dehydrogenase|nr:acyl-CoA dehydrogenase [Mycobacteriales bacterium]